MNAKHAGKLRFKTHAFQTCLALLVMFIGMLATPVGADDATVKTDPAVPAQPPAGAPPAVTDEQLQAAQAKAGQAEIDFLKAQIELEQLQSQRRLAELQEKLTAAEQALAAITTPAPAPAPADGEFIRNWLVLGPIHLEDKVSNHDEESCKGFLDRQYFLPAEGPLKEGDKALFDGVELAWKAVEAEEYFVNLAKFATDAGKDAEHAAFLGVVYVTSEAEITDAKLAIGSDDDCVWRLNGTEVIRFYGGRSVDKDQIAAEGLTLKQGVNVLSFTVLNGEGDCAAAARFLDKDGNPLKGLTFSANPPAAK